MKANSVKHPAIIQLRGEVGDRVEEVLKIVEKTCSDFEVENDDGVNIYVSDVNEARKVISKIKRVARVSVKMSTKYAGLRRGRVRTLFVYCVRFGYDN
ncbi:NMD3-related protein [Archaeoglobus veneficus]|uniref:Nmd3 N-terminal domain-containing protein n=1 Tax=Archaeoglobus veneficus (strain DSM 11195 / SNP6) TaxID=693661 RepID=F2KPU1_ARCVS|nr:NMD3-related protein [Archaeoglobus veneficus]AEA46448.1 hypothetical protein Arcve_0416 [Archaeoglobus veneficus SNP6]